MFKMWEYSIQMLKKIGTRYKQLVKCNKSLKLKID